MQAIKKILAAKTSWTHLVLWLVINWFIIFGINVLLMPFIYWFIFGEGQGGVFESEWLWNRFYLNFSPLFAGLIIVSICAFVNYKTGNLSSAKSYLIIMPALIILHLVLLMIYNW
jgi:hypothetical protein